MEIGIWADASMRLEVVKRLQGEGFVRNVEIRARSKDGREIVGLASAELSQINDEPCVLSALRTLPNASERNELCARVKNASAEWSNTSEMQFSLMT